MFRLRHLGAGKVYLVQQCVNEQRHFEGVEHRIAIRIKLLEYFFSQIANLQVVNLA
jgi:hypothetical protein